MNTFNYHLIGKIERDIVTIWFKTCHWKRFRTNHYRETHDNFVRTAWGWLPLGRQWQRSPEAIKPPSDRNMAIFTDYQAGTSCGLLAREYGCSKQRICQIVSSIARRTEAALRPPKTTIDRITYTPTPRVTIPQDIIDHVIDGTLTIREAARLCDCHPSTISHYAPGTMQRKIDAAHELYRTVYDAFIAGALMKDLAALMKDLAAQHNTTIGNIGQIILKARRLWNLPGKRKFRQNVVADGAAEG